MVSPALLLQERHSVIGFTETSQTISRILRQHSFTRFLPSVCVRMDLARRHLLTCRASPPLTELPNYLGELGPRSPDNAVLVRGLHRPSRLSP